MRSCAAAGGGGDGGDAGDAGDAGDGGDGGSDGGSDVLRGDDTQIWNAEEAGEGVMELSVNGRCLRPYQLGLVAAGDAMSSKAEREASYDASAPCIGFERVPVLADEASEPVVDGKPKPLECGRGIPC